MKCSNCGKKAEKADKYCSSCGQEIVFEEKIDKPKKQIFKVIMIIFIFIIAIINMTIFIMIKSIDLENAVSEMLKNEIMLILNILTLFYPALILLIIKAAGWIGIAILNVFGILLSLLTMIKASKKKKIILGILILFFIILTVVAFLTSPK